MVQRIPFSVGISKSAGLLPSLCLIFQRLTWLNLYNTSLEPHHLSALRSLEEMSGFMLPGSFRSDQRWLEVYPQRYAIIYEFIFEIKTLSSVSCSYRLQKLRFPDESDWHFTPMNRRIRSIADAEYFTHFAKLEVS